MADSEADFEYKDNSGSTVSYGGPAGTSTGNWSTSNKSVPAVADKVISQVAIITGSTGASSFQCSYDGGTTFITLGRNAFFAVDVKGEITQLITKADTGTIDEADVQLVINFEEY